MNGPISRMIKKLLEFSIYAVFLIKNWLELMGEKLRIKHQNDLGMVGG